MNKTAYRAYAKGNLSATADTPRQAAYKFFEQYPTKRKCSVIAGEIDGAFFVVRYGQKSVQSWNDITKHNANDLPDA